MTTARGTPNLSIAATQNTAPVYEFQCLYSHDLRKKKKLWHDGSLRYHTFNRRVMVYDESKNYIGDSHWREAEELQEGTELKLDKGVLVDVGDRIGETQTDLAPLLEKRRPGNASSPQRPPLRRIPHSALLRTVPGNPQPRPKSLSDVLGISQGPIGRARFPAQSPYEQLHHPPVQSFHCEQPDVKKPRIGMDKENEEFPEDRICRQESMLNARGVARTGQRGASGSSSLQEKRKSARGRQVIDISSEDETAPLPSSPLTPAPPIKESYSKASTLMGDKHLPTTSMPPPEERTRTAPAARSKFTSPKLATSNPVTVSPGTSYHDLLNRSSSSTGSSKSKLRLAVHKPRKKLLYEELLPSSNRSEPRMQTRTPLSAGRKTPTQGHKPSRNVDHILSKVRTFSGLENDGEAGKVPLGKSSSSRQSPSRKQDVERDLAELFAQSSSPLFVPKPIARATTGVPEPQSPYGLSSMLLSTASAVTPSPGSPTAPHGGSGPAAPSAGTPGVNCALQPAPPSKLTILDQELMMPPPNIVAHPSEHQQISPRRRSLRRVVSENDSPEHARSQGLAASLALGGHAVEVARRSRLPGQQPFQIPAKLTKSLSDTAAKPRARQSLAAKPAEDESTEDRGPWSKAEAYLLFDWFPPGREKLVLSRGEATSASVMVVKRGLLSDQLDAL